jgi:hypothetical protein
MRPFEGIRILDCTHVLAGPFAAYQLSVLGADVIKVEDPNDPDQSRESGADDGLNRSLMGTSFLTQGSNKRSIALNLKTEGGREALKRLAAQWADMFVENYRPDAFRNLGLGYEDLAQLTDSLHSGYRPKRRGCGTATRRRAPTRRRTESCSLPRATAASTDPSTKRLANSRKPSTRITKTVIRAPRPGRRRTPRR